MWIGRLGAGSAKLRLSDVSARVEAPRPRGDPRRASAPPVRRRLAAGAAIERPPEAGAALAARGGTTSAVSDPPAVASQRRTLPAPRPGSTWPQPSRPDVHATHRQWRLGEIRFCAACGAYSAMRRSAVLQAACGGRPASEAAARVRSWLLQGRHPATRRLLGRPRPAEE